MKNNKNSTWLSLTVITFLLFIIAFFAIGFKFSGEDSTIITLTTIAEKIKDAGDGIAGYVKNTYGLLVSTLVFISITIILVITKWVLNELNIKTRLHQRYWDILFLSIIGLSVILTIAGVSLYIDRSVADGLTIDSGRAAGLLILIILTIPLNSIPLFLSNENTDGDETEVVVGEIVIEA